MFNDKVSLAKSLTAIGKLFVLLISTSAFAEPPKPGKFFEYSSGPAMSRALTVTFGWFRTLDEEQEGAYYQSIAHALEYAENGENVTWYVRDASGSAKPVMTWPNTSGYCRRLHIQTIAYGVEKTKGVTACYNNTSSKWTWHADK